MPPKKKGGKKGKKSGRASAPAPPVEKLDEHGKDFFLVQVRDLEHRISRYQRKCDELELKSAKTADEHKKVVSDRVEMAAFLNKALDERQQELADLQDRYLGLQQTKEAEKEHFESQVQAVRNQLQETKETLQAENVTLYAQLSSLDDFKNRKEELENNLKSMEQEIEDQKKSHKDKIYELERKAVVDKDRLKKEMVTKVNQVAAEFRKVSNKQMAETTKRTIRENVSINAQLTKMSDKTDELIKENDELKAKEKKQKLATQILEHSIQEITKKNNSSQKIVRMLTEKCKAQDALLTELEMREQDYEDIEKEVSELRRESDTYKLEIESLSRTYEQQVTIAKEAKSTARIEKRQREKVDKVLADAAKAVQLVLSPEIKEIAEDGGINTEEARDNMLEHLLVLLNSAAAIGLAAGPGELGKAQIMREKSALSEMPGSRKGLRRGEGRRTPPTGGLPHYQLGDLGLVPRIAQNIPSHSDKVKGLSETTRLGGLRRVLTKSVAVQTVSSPKALFFADQLLSQASPGQQHAIIKDFNRKERMSEKFISKVF